MPNLFKKSQISQIWRQKSQSGNPATAKHKQYQAFPPDKRHKENQIKVEEKRQILETYIVKETKLTGNT